MELLRAFKANHHINTNNAKKTLAAVAAAAAATATTTATSQSQSQSHSFTVLELPDNPYMSTRGTTTTPLPLPLPLHQTCVYQQDPTYLYDPHRFGQLLGGLPSHPFIPFTNPFGPFFPNITDMTWRKDSQGLWIVQYTNITIFNLHVHCKHLKEFMSNREIGPLPYPPSVLLNK